MKEKRHFKSMRASLILMILVLLTSCIVAGTYAKYISSGTGGDYARIAKFGVEIEAGGAAFSNAYASKTEEQARATVMSVLSSDHVIAPGTSGEMASISVSGKPEVSVRVAYEGEFAVTNWEVIDKGQKVFYCPITIKVGDKEIKGRSFEDADPFAKAVNEAIASFSADYQVEDFQNTGLQKTVQVPKITWEWAFEGEGIVDEYDTQLGNKACETPQGENDKAVTITLIVRTTVTQID